MTVRIFERAKSGASSTASKSQTREYCITGLRNYGSAEALAIQGTPTTITTAAGLLYREDVSIEQAGYDIYYATVKYGENKQELGSIQVDFDTTGGTVHISTSKETVASYASAGNAPDNKQLIGYDGEDVAGVDIVIPALRLNLRYKHPAGFLSIPQVRLLAYYTGTVNSTSFLGFPAGEVLFLGASGSGGTDAEAEVQYSFAVSQNANGLTIGDLTGIAKKGHEYLWIRYKESTSEDKAVAQPEFAYVERVYDTADLAGILGFG